MKRVSVIGTSGSGKSTFSKKLAARMGADYVELDLHHWKPNWQQRSAEDFGEKVSPCLVAPCWVVDGNYSKIRELVWSHADTVIWLDYSFGTTLVRALKRAIKRAWSGEELWPGTGNVETFRKTFFSRDSIVLWTITTWAGNRRKYQALMAEPKWQHIEFIRFKTSKQADDFLESIG